VAVFASIVVLHFAQVLIETRNFTVFNSIGYFVNFLLFFPITVLLNDKAAKDFFKHNQFSEAFASW